MAEQQAMTAAHALATRMLTWLEPRPDDDSRCAICAWPLAATADQGCVRGNCSMRPMPDHWYAPARAKREYGPALQEPVNLAPFTFNLSADDVRLVLALLDARGGWQPIASAPKDGTPILVYGTDEHGKRGRSRIGTFRYGQWCGFMARHKNIPTHWMPLPAPPTEIPS